MPDFSYQYWPSVEACLKAADWKYKKTSKDENTYGDGTVLVQSPEAGTDFDPDNPPTLQFTVSTGNPE
jgi:beta-lactam-binding protein with PASTA domain